MQACRGCSRFLGAGGNDELRRLRSRHGPCTTSAADRSIAARARRRTGPLEFGERKPPKFEQQFDPFGESIYNKADYWEASFYSEPDDTPVEVYLDNLRKSEVISKIKEESTRFTKVESEDLADALAQSDKATQVVLASLPWCPGATDLLPTAEEVARDHADHADFYRVVLRTKVDAGILADVWMSPTVKVMRGGEEVQSVVNPTSEEVANVLTEAIK